MNEAREGGVDVNVLLKASMNTALRERLQAADINGDGILSAEELIQVFESEIQATRDRMLLRRILVALVLAVLLIVAAVVGLTYAVVVMSKDTSVDGSLFVSKDENAPLSTGSAFHEIPLDKIYLEEDVVYLQRLRQVTVPFGNGTAVFQVAGIRLVPGKEARIDTLSDGVSVVVNEGGISVLGDESVARGQGRRLSLVRPSTTGSIEEQVRRQCPVGDFDCICRVAGGCECSPSTALPAGQSCYCMASFYRACKIISQSVVPSM